MLSHSFTILYLLAGIFSVRASALSSTPATWSSGDACTFAKNVPVNVECVWTPNSDGTLQYTIRADPNGQTAGQDNGGPAGWCKGITDNIKGECGNWWSDEKTNKMTCLTWRRDWVVDDTGFPAIAEGVDMGIYFPGFPSDHLQSCMQTAIQKATCSTSLFFTGGGCKQGSPNDVI